MQLWKEGRLETTLTNKVRILFPYIFWHHKLWKFITEEKAPETKDSIYIVMKNKTGMRMNPRLFIFTDGHAQAMLSCFYRINFQVIDHYELVISGVFYLFLGPSIWEWNWAWKKKFYLDLCIFLWTVNHKWALPISMMTMIDYDIVLVHNDTKFTVGEIVTWV